MLAIDGFLRGLWIGVLFMGVWVLVSEFTGWGWMMPLSLPLTFVVMVIAAAAKIGKHLK